MTDGELIQAIREGLTFWVGISPNGILCRYNWSARMLEEQHSITHKWGRSNIDLFRAILEKEVRLWPREKSRCPPPLEKPETCETCRWGKYPGKDTVICHGNGIIYQVTEDGLDPFQWVWPRTPKYDICRHYERREG